MKRSRFFSSLILAGILSLVFLQACGNGSNESDGTSLPSNLELGGYQGPAQMVTLERADGWASPGQASSQRRFVTSVTYDEHGNQTQVVMAGAEGLPGAPQSQELEYGSRGKIIHSIWRDPGGTILWDLHYGYRYSEGQIEQTAYTAEGSVFGQMTFRFDGEGRTLSTDSFSYDVGGAVHSRVSVTYDGHGNVTERLMYYPADVLTSRSVQSYNEQGEEIESTTTALTGEGEIVTTRRYSGYEHDEHGNWTARLVQVESSAQGETASESRYAEYRTITYYPG